MQIRIEKNGANLTSFMRSLGYAPDRNQKSEPSFSRRIQGRPYPKFHIYVADADDAWILKLHLDQKKPSYEGTTAHSGEHDGPVVETEAERIRSEL